MQRVADKKHKRAFVMARAPGMVSGQIGNGGKK